MKTAVVTLGIGSYWQGCKVLLRSLEKHGMPDSVDRIMLHDPGESPPSDFATLVPVTDDYSDLPYEVKSECDRQRFINSFKRVFAFTLPYDRIIYMDADMLCVGGMDLLWGDKIGKLPWYACLDTAAQVYYAERLKQAAIDPVRVFNGGLEVAHPGMLDWFYYALLYRLRAGTLSMYDGADQGAINSYFQFSGIETGILPPGYNYVLDPNCPQVPEYHRRLLHFTGSAANPFTSPGRNDPDKKRYYDMWQREWKECGL
jgi:hypothetical protein